MHWREGSRRVALALAAIYAILAAAFIIEAYNDGVEYARILYETSAATGSSRPPGFAMAGFKHAALAAVNWALGFGVLWAVYAAARWIARGFADGPSAR